MGMGADKIRINTGSLNKTRNELQEKLNQVKKDIEQITADLNSLNAMWTGDAHAAFQGQTMADVQFLAGVCEGLQSIISYEGTAVTEYEKCEQQVSDLIAQIRI